MTELVGVTEDVRERPNVELLAIQVSNVELEGSDDV